MEIKQAALILKKNISCTIIFGFDIMYRSYIIAGKKTECLLQWYAFLFIWGSWNIDESVESKSAKLLGRSFLDDHKKEKMIISNTVSVAIYIVTLIIGTFTTALSVIADPHYFRIKKTTMLCFSGAFILYTAFELMSVFFDVTENLHHYYFLPQAFSDMCYIFFVISWLQIISEISAEKMLIGVKILIFISCLYFISVESFVFIHSDIITISLPDIISSRIIMGLNISFSLIIQIETIYYVVFAFRNNTNKKIRTEIIMLCVIFIIYMNVILHLDLVGYRITVDDISYRRLDPIIIVYLISCIVILLFFKKNINSIKMRVDSKELLIEDTWKAICENYGLTKRESEIVMLLQNGYENTEIAEKIFVSENTVKRHLNHIFSKTGTKNKYELLALIMKEMIK